MSSTLKILKETAGPKMTISLVGHIDGSSDYSSVSYDGVKELVIDFSGIQFINSLGIQKWVKFMAGIPSDIRIVFHKCPPRIVNQLNLFADFTAKKPVHFSSFQAPYYCEKCDESRDVLLEEGKHFSKAQVTSPSQACPKCGSTMELDAIADKYFSFLKRAA